MTWTTHKRSRARRRHVGPTASCTESPRRDSAQTLFGDLSLQSQRSFVPNPPCDMALTFVCSAIPFAFSAEEAISHIGVAASVAGYVGRSNRGQPNVPFTTLIASILAKYFPMSGFRPLQPTRIQPLYFPTWFVRAELEAKAWISSESDAEGSQVCLIILLQI